MGRKRKVVAALRALNKERYYSLLVQLIGSRQTLNMAAAELAERDQEDVEELIAGVNYLQNEMQDAILAIVDKAKQCHKDFNPPTGAVLISH